MTDQPKAIEPMPVQLTRIEGTVNLIAYQVGDLAARMGHLEGRVGAVELAQAANTGASVSWKSWLPIVAGLASLALAFVLALTGG